MKKVMISQPMRGIPDEEIARAREAATKRLTEMGYEVVDSYFKEDYAEGVCPEDVVSVPVHFLSRSLGKMATCNTVYFCRGWQDARGCRLEHQVATDYDLEVIEE